jgi:hypothetical protein
MQWHSAARLLHQIGILHIMSDCSTVAVLLQLCRCAVLVSQGAVALVIAKCCFSAAVVSAMPAGGRAHCLCWFSVGCRPGGQCCCCYGWVAIARRHLIPACSWVATVWPGS